MEEFLLVLLNKKSDDKGLVWPMSVAPFKVSIVLLNKDANDYANSLYEELNNLGIETILDDRNERAGVKFNDMDLIGIPIRITIGKGYNEGILEVKLRTSDDVYNVSIEDIISETKKLINE